MIILHLLRTYILILNISHPRLIGRGNLIYMMEVDIALLLNIIGYLMYTFQNKSGIQRATTKTRELFTYRWATQKTLSGFRRQNRESKTQMD